MDPRLILAIDASKRWYDDIFTLHHRLASTDGRMWVAESPPPPWHSAVKTLSPDVEADEVVAAMTRHPGGSVADSFGHLDLERDGFALLFEATWVHHAGIADANWPEGWVVVKDPVLLDEWCRAHDYSGVLVPDVLESPSFHILARIEEGEPTAGAVVHDAVAVTGLTNMWTSRDLLTADEVRQLLACAGVIHPGRGVVDYARGDELDVLVSVGYERLGPQRVWVGPGEAGGDDGDTP